MKFVYYEHKAPSEFEEHLEFSVQMPYTIRIKSFFSEDVVPLHYGKTIEILLCKNLNGQIRIQNRIYNLNGNQVFVIPPYTVHSNDIAKCNGILYVLKISLEDIEQYLNIVNLLASNGISLKNLAYQCTEYNQIEQLIVEMINNDGDFIHGIGCLGLLFSVLSKHTDDNENLGNDTTYTLSKSTLCNIIEWTQQNFRNHITLDDVANLTGYSKNYFCKLFRDTAGITFFSYLNSLRIENACLLLKKGTTVNDACYKSGFEDISYFIQSFKKIHKITPKQYAQRSHELTIASNNLLIPDWAPEKTADESGAVIKLIDN